MKLILSQGSKKIGGLGTIASLLIAGYAFLLTPSVVHAIDAAPPNPKCVWDPKNPWRCPGAFEVPGTKRECIWDVNGRWDITSQLGEYYIQPPQSGVPVTLQVSVQQWSESNGKPVALMKGTARNQNGETGQASIHWIVGGSAGYLYRVKDDDVDLVHVEIKWDRPRKFCCASSGPVDAWIDKYSGTISRSGELRGRHGWVYLMGDKPYTDQTRNVLAWRRQGHFRCVPTASMDDAVSRPPDDLASPPGSPPIAPRIPVPLAAPGAQPYGAIGDKYARLGGKNGALGQPIGAEADAPHGGRCHAFQHGTICRHPQIGDAYTVWGAIHDKWAQVGRVEFGYPITDERTTPDGRGRYNHFRGMQYPNRPESSIYWTPQTGAHAIYGAIRDSWAQQGWERGPLGYPTSDEHQDGKYRRVNFERGFIRWAPDTGIETGR